MTSCFTHTMKDPFVRFNKKIVEDTEISWKATGILSYAFHRKGLPGGWSFNRADLINRKTDGAKSLDSGLKELEETGYLYKIPAQNEATGQFEGWEYHFFEIPITQEQFEEFSKKDTVCQKGEYGETANTPKGHTTKKERTNKKEYKKATTGKPENSSSSLSEKRSKVLNDSKDLIDAEMKDLGVNEPTRKRLFKRFDLVKICKGISKTKAASYDNVSGYLWDVVSSNYPSKPDAQSIVEANRKLCMDVLGIEAIKHTHHGVTCLVELLNDYLQIRIGDKAEYIEYKDSKFKEKAQAALEKIGLLKPKNKG